MNIVILWELNGIKSTEKQYIITVYQIDTNSISVQEVEFAGRTYSCRVVKSNEGEELLIGSTGLLDALQPGSFDSENEGFASKEAEKLYDEIFFFTDAGSLELPDDELVEMLKEDNPEWFE